MTQTATSGAYKQKYFDLMSKCTSLQSEVNLLRQQSQLRQSTMNQHIEFLKFDNKNKKEQLERIEQKHKLDLEHQRSRVQETFRGTHEAVIHIYKSQQDRLQQLVTTLTQKLATQTKLHEKIVADYRQKFSQLYMEGFHRNSPIQKENVINQSSPQTKNTTTQSTNKNTMTLMEMYKECLGSK